MKPVPHLPNINSYLEPSPRGGFENKIIPGCAICDFCSDVNVVWTFTVDHSQTITSGDGLWRSVTNWAACPACKALVDADDRDALVRRSLASLVANDPTLTPREITNLTLAFASLHEQFFAVKDGPGREANHLEVDG